MSSIRLEKISQAYLPGERVIHDFSLVVEEGRFCTLVGPSGSGKTTILRLIAGLEKPSAGKIWLGEREVQQLAPYERGVGLVFQRPAIYPHLSVRENLAFGWRLEQSFLQWSLSLLRTSPEERSIDEEVNRVAELLGLTDILDRLPASLSGGQQQRLALGRALIRKPEVLLLDEPFSQLDAGLRSELRHELRILQRKLAATVIYVTHDQEEALALADLLVVIDRGRQQQTGPPAQVYSRPHNRFVAGFIGSPTMHFVDGHLCTDSGMIIWKSTLGTLRVPVSWQACLGGNTTELTVGFRPEDFVIGTSEPGLPTISMRVQLVERLGYANLITLERDGWQTVARVAAEICPKPGETVSVMIRMENAHLFDSLGSSLTRADSTA